jgi:carboxylate-amine ligase
MQECPKADIAICILIIEVLKALVNQEFCTLKAQKAWAAQDLFEISNDGIKHAEQSKINNINYISLFRIKGKATLQDLWKHLYQSIKSNISQENQNTI